MRCVAYFIVDLFIYFSHYLVCGCYATGMQAAVDGQRTRTCNTWRFTHGCPLHMSINAALHTARRHTHIPPGPFRCMCECECVTVWMLRSRAAVANKCLCEAAGASRMFTSTKTKERMYASAQRRETHWADTLVSQRWMSNKQNLIVCSQFHAQPTIITIFHWFYSTRKTWKTVSRLQYCTLCDSQRTNLYYFIRV